MFSIRRLRFTAAQMLFVWMFTLGAAFADACLLHGDHAPSGGVVAAMAQPTEHHGDGATHQHTAVRQQQAAVTDGCGAGSMPDAIACLGTHAGGQVPVAKPKSVHSLDPHADPLPVPTYRLSSLAVGEPPPMFDGSAFAPGPEPPVFIRFLRLTL